MSPRLPRRCLCDISEDGMFAGLCTWLGPERYQHVFSHMVFKVDHTESSIKVTEMSPQPLILFSLQQVSATSRRHCRDVSAVSDVISFHDVLEISRRLAETGKSLKNQTSLHFLRLHGDSVIFRCLRNMSETSKIWSREKVAN